MNGKNGKADKPHIPPLTPPNPPPLDSYDEYGEYKRALDRRLNIALKPPPTFKYSGMVHVITPVRLAITIGLDCTGEGSITKALEIVIPAGDFEALFSALNGQTVICWVQSVRPVEVQSTMEERPPAPTPQNATGLETELDPANDNRNWKD